MALELNCFLKVELNKVEHVGDSIMGPSKEIGKKIDADLNELREKGAKDKQPQGMFAKHVTTDENAAIKSFLARAKAEKISDPDKQKLVTDFKFFREGFKGTYSEKDKKNLGELSTIIGKLLKTTDDIDDAVKKYDGTEAGPMSPKAKSKRS